MRKRIPEYYRTMFMDGYTPTEILSSFHQSMNQKYKAIKEEQSKAI